MIVVLMLTLIVFVHASSHERTAMLSQHRHG